jgi:hypothetical protein
MSTGGSLAEYSAHAQMLTRVRTTPPASGGQRHTSKVVGAATVATVASVAAGHALAQGGFHVNIALVCIRPESELHRSLHRFELRIGCLYLITGMRRKHAFMIILSCI